MTRITIKKLLWDAYNIKHIEKHNVTVLEVEEAVKNFITHKKAKLGRFTAIGRSGSRLLSLIVKRESMDIYYLVTVRDCSRKERKEIYEKEKI